MVSARPLLVAMLAAVTCFGSASAHGAASAGARPATAAERKIFATFMPRSGPSKVSRWAISGTAVEGRYAVFGYTNAEMGGMGLLVKKHGTWTLRSRGGGYYAPEDLVRLEPSMSRKTADELDAMFRSQDHGG